MKLYELPTEIAELAKDRSDSSKPKISDEEDLSTLFFWDESPEGAAFWDDIDNGFLDSYYKIYPIPEEQKKYDMKLSDLPEEIKKLAIERSSFDSDQLFSNDKLIRLFMWGNSAEGSLFWQSIDKGNFKVFEIKCFIVDGSTPVLLRQNNGELAIKWENFTLSETSLQCLANMPEDVDITMKFTNTLWDGSAFVKLYEIIKSV